MPDTLKPCPFCDSTAEVAHVYYGFQEWYQVWCRHAACEATVLVPHHKTEAAAIAAWNRRPLEDALRKQIKTLKEEAEDARLEAKEEYP